MRNKKGFTLVELLAVIAILAIIGLIATPIVIDYMDKAKKDSIEESLNGIERAALTYFTGENIRNSTVVDLTTNTIEIKNKDISKGIVVGNRKGVKVYIYKNGYCGIKNGDNIVVKEVNENECNFNIDDSIEIIRSNSIAKEKKITGYRIYGNTVDNNSLGSNNNQIVLKLTGKNLWYTDSNYPIANILYYNEDKQEYTIPKESAIAISKSIYKLPQPIASGKKITISMFLTSGKLSGTVTFGGYHSGDTRSWQGAINLSQNVDLTDKKLTTTVTTNETLTDFWAFLYGGYAIEKDVIFKVMLEEGSKATEYEPYLEPREYTIRLSEPLRKIGNKVDYIDSSINQIVRNVGVKSDGTLYALEKPTYEYIKLPAISNLDGTTIVSASDGNISSSNLEIITQK